MISEFQIVEEILAVVEFHTASSCYCMIVAGDQTHPNVSSESVQNLLWLRTRDRVSLRSPPSKHGIGAE